MIAAALIAAPAAGALLFGLDRRLTARLQGRIGPPILQPLLDVVKLAHKRPQAVTPWQALCVAVFFVAAALSVALLACGADLLLIFFVEAVSSVFLVMGALAAASPFSQVGAHRELIQILVYEPLHVLVIVGFWQETGSFRASALLSHPQPVLWRLPLLFMVMVAILAINRRKSPFDLAASQHGHQEIVRGVLTDFSGPYLALIEMGHWYQAVLLLGLCGLFWASSLWGMLLLALTAWLLQIWLDTVCARLTWRWLLGYGFPAALALSTINLLWLQRG
jgi:ech hydrogenase subunit B